MTQKEKGYVGLGVMLVLAVGTVLGSDPLYKAVDAIGAEKVSYTAGTYTGTAQGFGGPVEAKVTVSESGIESVELKGDSETPELGGEALKKLAPAFVEANSSKVDAVAGCTVSSDAAMNAVQQALDQASGKSSAPAASAQTEEKADSAKGGASSYTAGTYEGTGTGFNGEIKAVVTVGSSGIEKVELTGDGETPELGGEALKKLSSAFVEAQSSSVDAVSGSTITSKGAMEAVQAALDQAQ